MKSLEAKRSVKEPIDGIKACVACQENAVNNDKQVTIVLFVQKVL